MRFSSLFLPILFIIAAAMPQLLQAQDNGIYQISGMVISKTSSEVVPFVRVQVNHTRRGAISNSEGFYSIPVGSADTLYFSHIGYHDSKLIVRDYLEEYQGDLSSGYLYVVNYLLEDSLTIDTVYIFPYDTPEELRTAVINMDVLESPEEKAARDNLDPEKLHTLMATLPVDGNERLMVARQMYYDYYRTQNLVPTIGFDPIAATRLLQHIVNRTRKKKNKDLNYWQD
ncbi:MAG: carboxypeptidase-like regulatory domain-containing protein [Bacteroidia bacterium]|nr:carboxypeptidase-like regulatory domain-containing protein [Bacteroidia bacterium]